MLRKATHSQAYRESQSSPRKRGPPFSPAMQNMTLSPTLNKTAEIPDICCANSGMTLQILWPVERVPLGAFVRIGYAAFMRQASDEQLMHRYAKGDARAFDQLYQRHRGPLYRYFKRQVNDATTANDLYQGTWEKIIKARRKYHPGKPYTAWMYRIAHNHLVDHFRRLQPAGNPDTENLQDDKPGLVEGLIEGQQREKLKAGIIALPAEQRNTLLLKLETGLKLEDIGRATGVSKETVKSRLRYAVNKLKQVLNE